MPNLDLNKSLKLTKEWISEQQHYSLKEKAVQGHIETMINVLKETLKPYLQEKDLHDKAQQGKHEYDRTNFNKDLRINLMDETAIKLCDDEDCNIMLEMLTRRVAMKAVIESILGTHLIMLDKPQSGVTITYKRNPMEKIIAEKATHDEMDVWSTYASLEVPLNCDDYAKKGYFLNLTAACVNALVKRIEYGMPQEEQNQVSKPIFQKRCVL